MNMQVVLRKDVTESLGQHMNAANTWLSINQPHLISSKVVGPGDTELHLEGVNLNTQTHKT